ncbi:MAG: hypothetical protein Q9210_004694 [Variospora velana]
MPMDNPSLSTFDHLFGDLPADIDDAEAPWRVFMANNDPASVRNRPDFSFSPLTSTNDHRRPHQRRRNRHTPSTLANADQSSSTQAHHSNSDPFSNTPSGPLNPSDFDSNQYPSLPYPQQSRFDPYIQIPDLSTIFPHFNFPDRPPSRFSLDSTAGDSLFGDSDFWPNLDGPASLDNTIDSNGFVDLTADSSPPQDMPAARKRRPSATHLPPPLSSPSCSSKRRKTNDGGFKHEGTEVAYLDLVDVDDDSRLSQVLDQQQAAAIDEQKGPQGDRPLKLSSLECRICLEPMTDITATHCGEFLPNIAPTPPKPVLSTTANTLCSMHTGHLFCHYCIMESLIAGENQGEPGKATSKCPLCRKKVARPKEKIKDKREVIPLEIKLCTRSSITKGKAKA